MHSLYKFFFLLLAVSVLLACEQKRDNVPEYSSRLVKENASFVRDTSAYAIIVDTTVHDSVFREETVPAERGGFAEYFASWHQKNNHETKIFYAYSDSISSFVRDHSKKSAFIDLIALAYARHYAMEINPDDIWLLILDGFRLHVKSNSDSLKDRFVGPDVDTDIKVFANHLTMESTHEEWFGVIADFFDNLQEKLPPETGAPLRTKFSTTSPVDYNISRSMIMAIASEYYTYTAFTLCGIPKIKINGTKEDWSLLKDSFNKLATRLDMEWWSQQLNPILDEFIKVFDGQSSVSFWKNIYKLYEPEGCGNPEFNGWFAKFYPYLMGYSDKMKFVKRTDWDSDIDFEILPNALTSVDVKWNYLGQEIPLKLYTGFIGIQVDTTLKMLKAARGYALRSQCGWCNIKNVADTLTYIPGKPHRMLEMLAISDSMNIYDKNGLAFATHDRNEIENFIKSSNYEEEYMEPSIRSRIEKKYKSILSVNLFKDGKLLDHLQYFVVPEENSSGILTLQGVVEINDKKSIESFFKERNIAIDGEVKEFENEKSLPKLNFDILVDTVVLKKGNSLREDLEMGEFKTGIIQTLKNSMGWRLKRLLYRYYNDDFNLSAVAVMGYKENGRVDEQVSLSLMPDSNKDFEMELKDILHYGYMPPEVHTDVGNDEIAQEIVDAVKFHIAFTRDYRMVCKQNGQDSKDSVDIVGAPATKKSLCSEIKFSKDLATGGVVRYECIEYNKIIVPKKRKKKLNSKEAALADSLMAWSNALYVEPRERIRSTYTNAYFNKRHDVYDSRYNLPISQVVTLKIPACFVEEK
ncbi:DUF4419 domain-containing protein [Fibrobacter sp.]|uniref:DUF4419 domain-containing protein n=1 Tax=Fibrobacter sp. TaxID=35828 RepID=UPI003866E9C2